VLAPGVEETAPEESPELDEDDESLLDAPEERSSLELLEDESSPEPDDESYGSLCVDDDVSVLVDVVVVFFATLASAGSSPS
jgi:hypothetical protein